MICVGQANVVVSVQDINQDFRAIKKSKKRLKHIPAGKGIKFFHCNSNIPGRAWFRVWVKTNSSKDWGKNWMLEGVKLCTLSSKKGE